LFQVSVTFTNASTLLVAMTLLALVPSVSVLAVSARAASSGFRHGVYVTLGIITGDTLFIVLAIFGLHLLAEAMDDSFVFIKYLGGAYLIWLGIRLWRSGAGATTAQTQANTSATSSFMTGLLITLGDQKAVLFYLGFFPAFMDLKVLTMIDALIVIAIAAVAVGGVKFGYAYAASRAGVLVDTKVGRTLNIIAACVMIVVAVVVMVRA
jgi:threonine/homoserine/homoserine lactone efflux protein